MNRILKDLIKLLNLETLEDNLFRGESRDLGGKSVFGGQVIGQALTAASRTVSSSVPHSLHAYFLRPGDMNKPIIYDVDRIRDGRSFTARRVQAIQNGLPILSMMVSFQQPEDGLEHQAAMPQVPQPEQLKSMAQHVEQWLDEVPEVSERAHTSLTREVAIEFKPIHPSNPLRPSVQPPSQAFWLRAAGALPNDGLLHRSVLAYATDFYLLSTALRPHAMNWFSETTAVASIDHAIWFHREFRVDDWLLYVMDSPTAQGARGLSRGLIYDRSGRLVASVIQENLMRKLGDD